MKRLASEIRPGDTVTYSGETFFASAVDTDGPSGLVKVTVPGSYPQFIAPEREVEIPRRGPIDPKPYKVLTRDYDDKGRKDVRRFEFATKGAQRSFMARTKRCITFFTD